jgi:hypothetical protein
MGEGSFRLLLIILSFAVAVSVNIAVWYVVGRLDKFITFLEEWLKNAPRKEIQPAAWIPSPATDKPAQERPTLKVPDLPPEAVAPRLRTPPRSAGFGSPPSPPEGTKPQT